MELQEFKQLHSELIKEFQCIEYDLKLIYAAIKPGDFESNFKEVASFSLGEIAQKVKAVDYSDNIPDLSEEEYAFIESIRIIRNYWCHQCYIDFMYITSAGMREEKFENVSKRLQSDFQKTSSLFNKLEAFRNTELKTYGRM